MLGEQVRTECQSRELNLNTDIPVTDRGFLQDCEMLKVLYCLDNPIAIAQSV
jgi:hypothetical protein